MHDLYWLYGALLKPDTRTRVPTMKYELEKMEKNTLMKAVEAVESWVDNDEVIRCTGRLYVVINRTDFF